MSQRVLATEEAQQSISQLQGILNNQFLSTITQMKTLGTNLSDPNVWDGAKAIDFRNNIWPSVVQALDAASQQLGELQQQLGTIQQNIMAAGGNV